MNLTDTQKKIFAILFAAGEPLETDRLAEALAVSHAEAAEQCVLLQQRLAESDLPPAGKQLAAVHHCRL